MAVKLHRCSTSWKFGPCWRVQKALDEQGIEYEVVKGPARPGKRADLQRLSSQKLYRVIERLDFPHHEAKDLLVSSAAITAPAERHLSATARRVLILGPPLVVAVYEIFHPRPDVTAAAVMDVAGWFALFHAIQLVLFPFLVLSIALLAQNLGVLGHWVTRVGLVLILVFFSAYDAIAGIATGLAMRAARDLPAAEQNAVFEVVKDWPGFDPAVVAIGIIAVLGTALALAMLTLGARRRQVGRGPVILLAVATIVALGGHPFPFGTVAFGCLFLAALWVERRGYGEAAVPARPHTTSAP